MRRKTILIIISVFLLSLLLCIGFVFAFVNGIRYNGPCNVPDTTTMEDITGTWRIQYKNYFSISSGKPINGEEIIVINPDGTYTQTFHSRTYNYESPVNQWKLVTDSGGGSKLVMYNLKYFADGLDLSDGPLHLGPQLPDAIKEQSFRRETGKDSHAYIDYPGDGFVYLYPRNCIGKLSLLQMRTGSGDPDNLAVYNLPFTKVR